MADPSDRHPKTVPGPYFTDNTCIDCDLCRELAPAVFRRDEEEGLSYVWRQPVTADEIARAEEAREACPTETIGRE